MKLLKLFSTLCAAGALAWLNGGAAHASSHSDAPLIKLDPQANLTDVYGFIRTRPGGQKVLVVEVSVHPFCEPGDGVMYDAFSDDARYSIHIANPNTGVELQRYDFRFSPVGTRGNYKNLDTVLRYGRGANAGGNPDAGPIMTVGDNHQNFVQTYTVTRVVGNASTVLNGGLQLLVPPCNTGARTTPLYNDISGTITTNPNYGRAVSGATARGNLDPYTFQTTYDLPGGQTVFCGSREDGFYADIPGIFDFLDPRILIPTGPTPPGAAGVFGQGDRVNGYKGVDGFKGYNVLHYSIVIPVTDLPAIGYMAPFTNGQAPGVGARVGVGIYASVSRPRVTLRKSDGDNVDSGPFIQVNRLGNPLFNEGLVAIRDKDNYNRTSPPGDAIYSKYAENPELAVLINAVYGTSIVTTGRFDLAAVFIPDVLRVDTTTGAARVAGAAGFNRLGFLGGDTLTNGAAAVIPGGWPNGRRFGDDVVDIALTALASGPTYTSIVVVGDNISHNDQFYNQTFPYAATPNAGTRNSKDSGFNTALPDLAVP